MTTDLDGKPMLCLKEADVQSLIDHRASPELMQRIFTFLRDCKTQPLQPTFDELCRQHPPARPPDQGTELPRPDTNIASMEGRMM